MSDGKDTSTGETAGGVVGTVVGGAVGGSVLPILVGAAAISNPVGWLILGGATLLGIAGAIGGMKVGQKIGKAMEDS